MYLEDFRDYLVEVTETWVPGAVVNEIWVPWVQSKDLGETHLLVPLAACFSISTTSNFEPEVVTSPLPSPQLRLRRPAALWSRLSCGR